MSLSVCSLLSPPLHIRGAVAEDSALKATLPSQPLLIESLSYIHNPKLGQKWPPENLSDTVATLGEASARHCQHCSPFVS